MTLEKRAAAFLSSQDLWKNTFVDVRPQQILADANAADTRQLGSQKRSAVDGLFLAVKANVDLKGFISHAGSVAYAPRPALADAPIVSRLREAGAVVLGHVNMSEFAFSGLGVNPHYGASPNALDPSLVPGGSSSGSASAVAMGFADAAIGTDTSGSVRVPAACQGIFGFRPTIGRYPDQGILPLAPSLDTPGLLTKDVSQLLALDNAILGQRQKGSICKHFICLDEAAIAPFGADIRQMYHVTIERLQGQGLHIKRCSIESFQLINELFETQGTLVGAEAVQQLGPLLQSKLDMIDQAVQKRLAQSCKITPENYYALQNSRTKLRVIFARELSGHMLVYPTLLSKPPTLQSVISDPVKFAHENAQILKYPMYAAYLNAPTMSLPVDNTTPGSAVSISAASGCDRDVLATGNLLASVLSKQTVT